MTDDDSKKRNDEFEKTLLQAGRHAIRRLYQSYLMRIKNGETLTSAEIKTFKRLEKELEGGEEKESSRIKGFGDAAVYCGVSERTISHHLKRGNLRQNPDGSFDREVLDAYLAKYGRRRIDKELAHKRMAADLRYRLARAEKEETLVAQLKGELFSFAEIEEGWAWRVSEVTAAMQSLADRLPPLLVGKGRIEMAEVIRAEVWSIRDRFAREGQFTPKTDSE